MRRRFIRNKLSRLDNILKKLYNKTKKYFLGKVVIKLISGVILALLISFFTGIFSDIITKRNEFNEYLYKVNHISLGYSKSYVDEMLGLPFYQAYDSNTSLNDCIYIMDSCLVRTYYKDSTLVGYFITTLNTGRKNRISLNKYEHLTNGKTLGHFNYYEIEGNPINVINFVTMGNARSLYLEAYYFGSLGNYRNFYFGTFDYGPEIRDPKDYTPSEYYDDEVDATLLDRPGILVIDNRRTNYPNTYGIANLDYSNAILTLVQEYFKFDIDIYSN